MLRGICFACGRNCAGRVTSQVQRDLTLTYFSSRTTLPLADPLEQMLCRRCLTQVPYLVPIQRQRLKTEQKCRLQLKEHSSAEPLQTDTKWQLELIDQVLPLRLGSQYLRADETLLITSYTGLVKDSIIGLKFKQKAHLAELLALILQKRLPWDSWREQIVLVPIPLSEKREKERGYNQVMLVLQHLARNKNLAIADLLVKQTTVARQSEQLSREARETNIKGAFKLKPVLECYNCQKEELKEKILILVDDVYTTGATLLEAHKTLLSSGYNKVLRLALAID